MSLINEPKPGALAGWKTHIAAIGTIVGSVTAYLIDDTIWGHDVLSTQALITLIVGSLFAMTFRSAQSTESERTAVKTAEVLESKSVVPAGRVTPNASNNSNIR